MRAAQGLGRRPRALGPELANNLFTKLVPASASLREVSTNCGSRSTRGGRNWRKPNALGLRRAANFLVGCGLIASSRANS